MLCQHLTFLHYLKISFLLASFNHDEGNSSNKRLYNSLRNVFFKDLYQDKSSSRLKIALGKPKAIEYLIIVYHFLYGKNLPSIVITIRSPFGSSFFSISIVKSIALIMPSPHFSCITCLNVVP